MKRLGRKQREDTLLLDDYQCCLCGFRFFCDVHHIKPRSEGGGHEETNLVTLCPTCHRAVHAGEVTPAALRRRRTEHRKTVLRRREGMDKVSFMQILFVHKFIDLHFGSGVPDPTDVSDRDEREIFFIVFDFDQAGTIIRPASGKPLVIEEDDLPNLAGLEVVITPARARFLRAWHRTDQSRERYYVVRADVIIFLANEEEVLSVAREYNDSQMRASLEQFDQRDRDLAEFIEADVPLEFQHKNVVAPMSDVDDEV